MTLDFDDRRNRIACLPEELQTDRARECAAAMQDPARAGDDAVAAFLLYARQAAQKFISDILAEPDLAEALAGNREPLFAQDARPIRALLAVFPDQLKNRGLDFMNLAEVVAHARDFEPVT